MSKVILPSLAEARAHDRKIEAQQQLLQLLQAINCLQQEEELLDDICEFLLQEAPEFYRIIDKKSSARTLAECSKSDRPPGK